SGGERQRVFLAKALAQQTEVLLLDEPTAALDLVYADDIFHEGRRLCDEGKTILIVVHDLELAAKYCTKLVL
ncbi:ABC transporter related protein, partial [human gut metagenome]